MKVGRGGKTSGGGADSGNVKRAAKGSPSDAPAFVEAIKSAEDRVVQEDLDRLIKQIEEQADVLVRRQTDTELQKYRELVTGFMKRVVGESYSVNEVPSVHFLKNSKVYIITRRIEEKLLALAEQIHARTADARAVAAATSEIRGMLMDLKA